MKKILSTLTLLSVLVPSLAFASVGITLTGGPVTVSAGQSYTEPGYSALSTVDGDVTADVVTSGPNITGPGQYFVSYSVTDSALDIAFASRSVTQASGGGTMPWCSSPMASGWNVSLVGGGCGGTQTYTQFNHTMLDGTMCEFFSGCIVQ